MVREENVRLAAAGDLAALEDIYRSYYRRVYSRCLRMTRNTSVAEDLTQDVFVQLFRKLKTFRGESSFTTWLHRITVNVVLMHFRRPVVRLEQTTADGVEPYGLVSQARSSIKSSILDRISLNEALAKLAPGYRTVFILHDIEGYEHNQIGKILGCSPGTSKSQLHKARIKLRNLLGTRAFKKVSTPITDIAVGCRQDLNAAPSRLKSKQLMGLPADAGCLV